jgi:hypothetical protein
MATKKKAPTVAEKVAEKTKGSQQNTAGKMREQVSSAESAEPTVPSVRAGIDPSKESFPFTTEALVESAWNTDEADFVAADKALARFYRESGMYKLPARRFTTDSVLDATMLARKLLYGADKSNSDLVECRTGVISKYNPATGLVSAKFDSAEPIPVNFEANAYFGKHSITDMFVYANRRCDDKLTLAPQAGTAGAVYGFAVDQRVPLCIPECLRMLDIDRYIYRAGYRQSMRHLIEALGHCGGIVLCVGFVIYANRPKAVRTQSRRSRMAAWEDTSTDPVENPRIRLGRSELRRIITDTNNQELHRLHSTNKAAVEFRCGRGLYRYEGVQVPEHVILWPGTITINEIDGTENEEVRRILIEQYGFLRYLEQKTTDVLDQRRNDIDNVQEVLVRYDRNRVALVTACCSTNKKFVLPLPGDTNIRTCEQAQEWLHGTTGGTKMRIIGAS